MIYYYIPNPPFLLLAVGFFISITCGLSFEAMLKQEVKAWSKSNSTKTLSQIQNSGLLLPFFGVCVGICVFLAAGLEIFTFNRWFSYGVSLPMTLFTGALLWSQLGKVLVELEQGGSKALDLDAIDI